MVARLHSDLIAGRPERGNDTTQISGASATATQGQGRVPGSAETERARVSGPDGAAGRRRERARPHRLGTERTGRARGLIFVKPAPGAVCDTFCRVNQRVARC